MPVVSRYIPFTKYVINRYVLSTCVMTKGAAGVFANNNKGVIVDLPDLRVNVSEIFGALDKNKDFADALAFALADLNAPGARQTIRKYTNA